MDRAGYQFGNNSWFFLSAAVNLCSPLGFGCAYIGFSQQPMSPLCLVSIWQRNLVDPFPQPAWYLVLSPCLLTCLSSMAPCLWNQKMLWKGLCLQFDISYLSRHKEVVRSQCFPTLHVLAWNLALCDVWLSPFLFPYLVDLIGSSKIAALQSSSRWEEVRSIPFQGHSTAL